MPTIPSMVARGWGDPTAPNFGAENIVSFDHDGRRFRVNKAVKPLFHGFLILLRDKGGVDITAGPILDDWSWVVRPIRGYENVVPTPYSYHSFGLAIDLDSSKNPLGSLTTTFPVRRTNRYADDCSLTWGYNWRPPSRPDPQHFEFNLDRDDVRPALRKLREKHPDVFAAATA